MSRTASVLLAIVCSSVSASAAEKVFNSGPDAQKLVFVVMGDGYTTSDLSRFKDDTTRLIVDGLIGHDLYRQHRAAFNVYRVDSASTESGVSTIGQSRNTAFGAVYNGNQKKCWISDGPETVRRIVAASEGIDRVDFFVLVVNTPNHGGCARGNRLYLTSGSSWQTAAHEYGHGIGKLFDEYSAGKGSFPVTTTLNDRNCSNILDGQKVAWRQLLSPVVSLPTSFMTGFDPTRTVGMFEGCNEFETAVYRPVHECRMKRVDRLFCPVCTRVMRSALAPYLAVPPPTPPETFVGESQFVSDRNSMVPAQATPSQIPLARAASSRTAQVVTSPPTSQPQRSSHVNLVMEIFQNGRIDILRATEGGGPVPRKPTTGSSWVYELSEAGRPLAVEALPEDILTERSYGPPGETPHRDAPAESATVSVTVPNMTLERLTNGKTSLQLYQVRGQVAPQVINIDTLTDLKRRNLVLTKGSLSPAQFNTKLLQQMRFKR